MALIVDFEQYYIPIKLNMTTQEKPDVKHFYWGCENCEGVVTRQYNCGKCKKIVFVKRVYPQGEKEEVGSRDLWDLKRVPLDSVDLVSIDKWKWLVGGKLKKPKASEVEKMNKYRTGIEKQKTSLGLKELYYDLAINRQALKGKIVLNSKKNEVIIFPYPFIKQYQTLIFAITDGNRAVVSPEEQYPILEKEKIEELVQEYQKITR